MTPDESDLQRFCAQCGVPLTAGVHFCTGCGTARSGSPHAPVAPQAREATIALETGPKTAALEPIASTPIAPAPVTARPPRRRFRFRKATWAILLWTLAMGAWIVAGLISSARSNATDCGSLSQSTCNAASDVGTGIGVFLLLALWFFGFIVLSLVWLMSRPKELVIVQQVGPIASHDDP